MTKLMTTLTMTAIASILIIGGFTAATPNAFSTYGSGHHNDDDCDNWNYGYYHDDDCDDEPEPEKTGTITIRKAITNDNGGEATVEDFVITLTNVKSGEKIQLIHDQEEPSMNINEVPTGTYTLNETIADHIKGTYTTVLISGDNKCPSMTNEEFKIKKNKHISCTIYNDDDGNAGGDIEPGVIFHFDSVKFDLADPTAFDGCDAGETTLPCIINDGTRNTIVPNLQSGEELRVSTLVLISAVGLDPTDNTDA